MHPSVPIQSRAETLSRVRQDTQLRRRHAQPGCILCVFPVRWATTVQIVPAAAEITQARLPGAITLEPTMRCLPGGAPAGIVGSATGQEASCRHPLHVVAGRPPAACTRFARYGWLQGNTAPVVSLARTAAMACHQLQTCGKGFCEGGQSMPGLGRRPHAVSPQSLEGDLCSEQFRLSARPVVPHESGWQVQAPTLPPLTSSAQQQSRASVPHLCARGRPEAGREGGERAACTLSRPR